MTFSAVSIAFGSPEMTAGHTTVWRRSNSSTVAPLVGERAVGLVVECGRVRVGCVDTAGEHGGGVILGAVVDASTTVELTDVVGFRLGALALPLAGRGLRTLGVLAPVGVGVGVDPMGFRHVSIVTDGIRTC
jgi:hypothetical protein